jgi:hypothetical protein
MKQDNLLMNYDQNSRSNLNHVSTYTEGWKDLVDRIGEDMYLKTA